MSQQVPTAAGDWIGPLRFSLYGSLSELWCFPARVWVHRDLVSAWVKREWSALFLGTALDHELLVRGAEREVGLVCLERSWRLEEAVAQSNPWTVSSSQEMLS